MAKTLTRRMLSDQDIRLLMRVAEARKTLTVNEPRSPWSTSSVDHLLERGLVEEASRNGPEVTVRITLNGRKELALLGG